MNTGKILFFIVPCIMMSILYCSDGSKDKDVVRTYFPTGELQHLFTMKDSLLDGMFHAYYKDGTVEYEKEYVDDIPVNDHYYYNSSGKLMEYEFFDISGNLRYRIIWSSVTNRYEEEGKPLYVQGDFLPNYNVGDTLRIAPRVANPFKSPYIIGLLSCNDSLYKTYQHDAEIIPLFVFPIEQNCRLSLVSSISHLSGALFRRDTVSFSIAL